MTNRTILLGNASIMRKLRNLVALPLIILVSSHLLPISVQAAAGDLDPTFGNGGKVITDFGSNGDSAKGIAIQGNGKIIAVGTAYDAEGRSLFAIARYNTDGSLDSSFGTGGRVTTDFFIGFEVAEDVAIQSDGRILVAGFSERIGDPPGPGGVNDNFALARYNSDGSLDTSFGAGGKIVTDFFGGFDQAKALTIQTDGKIVIAGVTTSNTTGQDFAIARYNNDGSLDLTFGTDGKLNTDFLAGNYDEAIAVIVQSDSKIVAVGTHRFGSNGNFALSRYNNDGSLDISFGIGGKVTTDFGNNDEASDAVIQGDNKIVVVGIVDVPTGRRFGLARYNTDGSLDISFGIGGKVTTSFTIPSGDEARCLSIQSDGKIVAAGRTVNPFTVLNIEFALIRYNIDGGLDTSFGVEGKVSTGFDATNGIEAIDIQSDGKIVAAGKSNDNFALARYNAAACTMACSSNITKSNDPNMCGAAINYASPIASGSCGTVTCNPPSGSFFLIGTTTVNCNSNESSRCSFIISVMDTQSPTIACPANLLTSVNQGDNNAIVNYSFPTATDNCSNPTVVCSPGSGSNFPIGTTTVNCTASDATSNRSACAFTVTVTTSPIPVITNVSVSGKKLFVMGERFDSGAVILINGDKQKTANDDDNPTTRLIGKKAGKKIKPGDKLQVRNSDGTTSPEFIFTR